MKGLGRITAAIGAGLAGLGAAGLPAPALGRSQPPGRRGRRPAPVGQRRDHGRRIGGGAPGRGGRREEQLASSVRAELERRATRVPPTRSRSARTGPRSRCAARSVNLDDIDAFEATARSVAGVGDVNNLLRLAAPPPPAMSRARQRAGGAAAGDPACRPAAGADAGARPPSRSPPGRAGGTSPSGTGSEPSSSGTATTCTSAAARVSRCSATSRRSSTRCGRRCPPRPSSTARSSSPRRAGSTSTRCSCASTRPPRGWPCSPRETPATVILFDLLGEGATDLRDRPAGDPARAAPRGGHRQRAGRADPADRRPRGGHATGSPATRAPGSTGSSPSPRTAPTAAVSGAGPRSSTCAPSTAWWAATAWR